MAREPWFWRSNALAAQAAALCASPLSFAYDLAQRARARLAAPAPPTIPVICIGAATLGGVGKTPMAIAIHSLLSGRLGGCHFVTRGYGGAEKGPLQVDPDTHAAGDVGDEALLLARRAPTWVSRDRNAGAMAAKRAGAAAVIMDDGYQNPTIAKTASILIIDAADPDGNGRVFPAGPLREPLRRAKSRADIVIFVGETRKTAKQAAEENNAPFAAWLAPVGADRPSRVVAFAGIARPERFFNALRGAGFDLAQSLAFPDHHEYSARELSALDRLSLDCAAPLITTEKDHVRFPKSFAQTVATFPVAMELSNPDPLASAILAAIARNGAHGIVSE